MLQKTLFFSDMRFCKVPDISIDGSTFIFLDYKTKNFERITIIPDVCSDVQSHIVTSMKFEAFRGFIFLSFSTFSYSFPPACFFFLTSLIFQQSILGRTAALKCESFPNFQGLTSPPRPHLQGVVDRLVEPKPITRFRVC